MRSPKYFNVADDKIGRVTSRLMFVAMCASTLGLIGAGYLYDIFGRKMPIVIYFCSIAIGLYSFPRTAPSIPLLVLVRSILQALNGICLSHPLINDYVKKESRGKAIAMAGFGVMTGEAFGMAVLFEYSKDMEPKRAFFETSLIILAMTVPFLFIVKDPVLKSKSHRRSESDVST